MSITEAEGLAEELAEELAEGLAEGENTELTLDTASGFDVILNNKIKEINELYELKTKNKKMTSNVNEINFMDKKLYNKINAAIDKKYKESKQYKKKCEEEVQNAL
jgi:predicted DNA-binding transcriptional regulator YafY